MNICTNVWNLKAVTQGLRELETRMCKLEIIFIKVSYAAHGLRCVIVMLRASCYDFCL